MTYRGTVTAGAIILDDGAQLPEGAMVQVVVVTQPTSTQVSSEDFALQLYRMSDDGTAGFLPADVTNHFDDVHNGSSPPDLGEITANPGVGNEASLPKAANDESSLKWEKLQRDLLAWAGSAEGLPADAASQLDHYLYGLPKR